MRLKVFSLIISVLGISVLLLISLTTHPEQISSYNQLRLNTYAKITGKITEIKNYNEFNVIRLNNSLTLICNKCNFKLNQTIAAEGKSELYGNKFQINAETIELIE